MVDPNKLPQNWHMYQVTV